MEKYRFTVGALCELYPEGYVGVSDVCIMGLNEGKGGVFLQPYTVDSAYYSDIS